MSGIDEQGVMLPKCPYCKTKPYYYTLGSGEGSYPILWLYDSIKSPEKGPVKAAKEYLTVHIIRNDIEYAYCGECDQIMTDDSYPDFLAEVIEIAINAMRSMKHEWNR